MRPGIIDTLVVWQLKWRYDLRFYTFMSAHRVIDATFWHTNLRLQYYKESGYGLEDPESQILLVLQAKKDAPIGSPIFLLVYRNKFWVFLNDQPPIGTLSTLEELLFRWWSLWGRCERRWQYLAVFCCYSFTFLALAFRFWLLFRYHK